MIRLNDGTVLKIQDGATEHLIKIAAKSIDEIVAKFTDENLAKIEFMNETEEVFAIYTKKHLNKAAAELTEGGYVVTLYLTDIDEIYERIAALELTVENLMAAAEATAEKETEEEIETE